MRNENYYYSIYCQFTRFSWSSNRIIPWYQVTSRHLSYKRVLMGLNDRRKTAKNLVDSRKD